MADNNYFNPASMKPQSVGLMDMYFYPQQMQNYMDIQQVARKQQEDALLRHMLETEDYRRDMPVKSAQRKVDISKAGLADQLNQTRLGDPTYAPAIVGGERGDAQIKDAAGQVAMGTVPSSIASTNSKNSLATLENTGRRLELLSSTISPLAADAEWKQVYDTLPPEVQRNFSPHYTPQTLKQIQAFSMALQNTPAHRAELETQARDLASKERIAKGNNQATVDAARARATANVKGLLYNFQAAKTPEAQIYLGQQLLANPDLDEQTRTMVQAGVEAAARILAQKNARGSIDLNNPLAGNGGIQDDYFRRLLPGQQQPGSPAGRKINIPGVGEAEILSINPDGSIKFRAPNGRTGTYRP